jgi:hypothetical protein
MFLTARLLHATIQHAMWDRSKRNIYSRKIIYAQRLVHLVDKSQHPHGYS